MGQPPEWHSGSCFQSRACIESTAPVWARFFFSPHSVLEITLYHEALFSHSNVLSLHLQDEVECSPGNDGGGKEEGFLASQSIVEERHVCRHPHQCREASQAFLGEESLFMLDVLC